MGKVRAFVLGAMLIHACGAPTAVDDAGTTQDAALVDASSDSPAPYVRPDGGPTGAAIEPTDPCDDVASALYDTPAGLPPFDASVRGALLGCASLGTIDAATLATRLAGVTDLEQTGGAVRSYLIAYRTEREPRGVGGISTALVFLPDVALAERVPMVLVAHGSVGVADVCAPSHAFQDGVAALGLPADYVDALLLSFAARGLPVVVPDYAGLGTEGTHDYGNWLDPARSALDGIRALRAMLPADRLDGGTIVYGHSQGGGVALASAALASETPDVELRAIVAAAPGYRVAPLTQIVGFDTYVLTPLLRAIAIDAVYGGYANLTSDETQWVTPFEASLRSTIATEVSTHCLVASATALDVESGGYVPPATVGALIDPTFRDAVNACASGGACDGLPGMWAQRDAADEPHVGPGVPILVLASQGDTTATPGTVGCAIDRIRREGATYETCMVSAGDHLPMVSATAEYAIAWGMAARDGSAHPPCPGSTTPPRCQL